MTLSPDPIDPRNERDQQRWVIDCDAPGCADHLHVGVFRRDNDPRLAAQISGWALDIHGKDFCTLHRLQAKLAEDEQLEF